MVHHARSCLVVVGSFICALVVACTAAAPPATTPPTAHITSQIRETRVLFVGNSLTYTNDMPRLFERHVAAAYPDRHVVVKMIAPPGESLAGHRQSGAVLKEIEAGHWDYVVLQDRGVGGWKLDGRPLVPPPEPYVEDVAGFAQAIAAHGGKPVLYQTWGSGAATFGYVDYATMLAAHETHSIVAPIGRAWWALAGKGLVGDDGMHPSLRGSVLIAMTLAGTLFGAPARPPATALGLPQAELAELQAVASKTCDELARAGGIVTLPRPEYETQPAVARGMPITAARLAGTWRAKQGGTRLSAGTELRITMKSVVPTIVVREYTPSERVELPVEHVRIEGDVLRFRLKSANVAFDLELAVDDGVLHGLTQRGTEATRRSYRTVRYVRDGEQAYFTGLDKLYGQRDREEATLGLAQALSRHYERLTAFVGQPAMTELLEGGALDEWMQILAAWFHAEHDEPRALAYFHAAVELHPTSIDALLQLADALGQTDKPAEARTAYERARTLDRASPGGPHAEITKQIDAGLAGLASPAQRATP